jgi:two-component system chemotaxis response regulator CheY
MQILIVDDSRAMRSIVIRAVRAAGFEQASFREATNGAEALALVREWKPDLVVSDWNMPEMSGIELLRKLREEGNGVRLGFVTSESDPAQRDVAASAGALFLISKPFTPEAVKAALGPLA